MRVAVLGPIPRDVIVTCEGQTDERYGGALYTTAALASLGAGRVRVHPVAHVSAANLADIRALLAGFDAVDPSRISDRQDQGTAIRLQYRDHNRRDETQVGCMTPIQGTDLDGLEGYDAFIVVPITDFEVPLATLRALRSRSTGLIAFDAHGPTMGCAADGTRFRQDWIDRDVWLPHIDLLKMNLEEARHVWFERTDEGEPTMDELPRLAEICLSGGVRALYVTLDQHGCVVYDRVRGRLRERVVPRVQVDRVVDTTGCGDSFAAGMVLGYLLHGDHLMAARLGNYAGARRCVSQALDAYGTLAEAEACLADAYAT
ncbi:PfkB family carbohydrate kinase [uncultured Jannaschia sp.]|uniref:carbohydrate kinase family protein n=1 Tax=uncultured Jannaschia sp. TaxID=293347 RepID=UPI0026368FD3|nr:PfkB family carbohydrate kinase [uncultured Jannaschia sp.]